MTKKDLQKYNLPKAPGVYFFRDQKNTILYIGKATNLKSRVESYFRDDLIKARGPLLVDMVSTAKKITYQETDSALEALILESDFIKKHQPYFNTREKDDRSYYFVVITDEPWPRIFLERGRILGFKESLRYKTQKIYGPYPSGPQITEALRIIRKIFPYLGRNISDHTVRFYKQLGLSPDNRGSYRTIQGGTEQSDITALRSYKNNIRNIKLFLSGHKSKLLSTLKKEMRDCAKREEFERAAKIRNQIYALEHINDISLIKKDFEKGFDRSFGEIKRIEAYDIAHLQGSAMIGVMTVIEGSDPIKSEYRTFNIRTTQHADDNKALEEVVTRRLNHPRWRYPDLIVVDGGEPQRRRITSVVKDLKLQIPVISVVKNEKHQPKAILGPKKILQNYPKEIILLANSESHRFAITKHRAKLRKQNIT